MTEKVSEMTTEPIVGEFYLVECVRRGGPHSRWIPIVGEKHSDLELSIPTIHYHRDPRFVKDGYTNGSRYFTPEVNTLAAIVPVNEVKERKLRRLKCRRAMPEFPCRNPRNSDILPTTRHLEPIYVGKKVSCGRCPHRNMPLDSLPKGKNGIVICNGHGLAIDTKKMEVVSRVNA